MQNPKPLAELFISYSNDPHINVALEEWLLKHYQSQLPIVFLWQNDNAIFIGRNQNTHLEVNQKLVEQYQVRVTRRLSGGGAVYQDLNNQCWTFIEPQNLSGDYLFFSKPILEFLHSLGVDAHFQGRNDLAVDGKKISGTAQLLHKNRTLCHGTILFDVNLALMTSLLTPNLEKLSSKGVDSVRKRVLNLKEVLNNMDFKTFQTKFFDYIENYYGAKLKPLPQAALEFAQHQKATKFGTYEWNYGESRHFEFVKKQYFPHKGNINICFNTEKNIINDLQVYGDFLSKTEIDDFVNLIIGLPYQKQAILNQIRDRDLSDYLGEITIADFVECMFN